MLTYKLLVLICWLINRLPIGLRVAFFNGLLRFVLIIVPRLKRAALTNLQLAFPEKDDSQLKAILMQSTYSFARGLVDTLRLPIMDKKWVMEHVDFPDRAAVVEAVERAPNGAALFVTGHFNSFEISPRCISEYINRTGFFVARALKNPHIDRWWNELRGEQGNAVINRAGGMKKIIDLLKKGVCVGLVFDQNVTRKQAVFVDWFGQPAATTKAMAYCHLRLHVPIILVVMNNLPNQRYKIEAKIFEYQEGNTEESLNDIEKLEAITQRVSDAFTEFVRQDPAGWFWLHRRWKTRPRVEDPSLYLSQ